MIFVTREHCFLWGKKSGVEASGVPQLKLDDAGEA